MSKKILIVDDDSIVRASVSKLLRLKGYDVVEAGDGSEGIEAFQKNNVDLVIVDNRMPGLNGVETIEAMRVVASQNKKRRPVEIILTGYSEKKSLERCAKLGVSDIVFKPFDVFEFIDLIKQKFL